MQYDPEYLARFYDAYDLAEWDRLEVPAYGRLQAVIHADFVKQHVRRGDRVADIGCGPGRFAVEAAMLGAAPTLVDLSPQQLARAGERLSEAGFRRSAHHRRRYGPLGPGRGLVRRDALLRRGAVLCARRGASRSRGARPHHEAGRGRYWRA